MKKIKSPFLTTHFSESGKNAKKRIGSILNTKPKKIGAAAICFVLLFAAVAGGTVAVKKIETGINAVTDTENVTYFGNINIDELYQTRTPYAGNHIADGKVISALKIFDTFGASTTSLQTAAEPYGITLDFRDPVSGELSLETEACAMLALIENLHYVEWKYTNALGETQRTRFTAEDASERLGADVKSFGESRIKLLEMFMINSGCREDMEYLKNLDSTPEEAVVLENGQIVQEGRSPEFLNRENSTKKYSEDRLIVIDKNGSEEKRTIIHLRDGVYSGAYYTLNHSTHCEKYGTVGRWGSIISQKYDGRTQCMLLPINPWMSIAYTVFEEGDYYADTIDSAVGDAVIRNNEGKYLSCEFKAEGHVILDSVTTEKTVRLYMLL